MDQDGTMKQVSGLNQMNPYVSLMGYDQLS